MRRITDFKVCEVCNGPCQFIECNANPIAAEWYCEKCHKSYPAREYEPQAERERDNDR